MNDITEYLDHALENWTYSTRLLLSCFLRMQRMQRMQQKTLFARY
jgi:hypothetical protein